MRADNKFRLPARGLTVGADCALIPHSHQDAWQMAQTLAKATCLGDIRGQAADVFYRICAGLELGVAPLVAVREMHVIKGRAGLSAHLMAALVRGSGAARYLRRTECTDTRCTWVTARRDDPEHELVSTFTIEMAQRRGYLDRKDSPYLSMPERMLSARALSALIRDVYPEVVSGVAALETLHDDIETAPAGEENILEADPIEDGDQVAEEQS